MKEKFSLCIVNIFQHIWPVANIGWYNIIHALVFNGNKYRYLPMFILQNLLLFIDNKNGR
jgi:hypothetical protein